MDEIQTPVEGGDANGEQTKKNIKEQVRESKVALAAISFALAFSLISYLCGYFDDRTDFSFQKVLFTVWAVAALFCGLNFGYTHNDARRFWILADTVWISTAVLSFGSLLNPVEEVILNGKVEVLQIAAEGHHRLITNEIMLGAKAVCSNKMPAGPCRDWLAFQTQVDAQNVTPGTLLGRVQLGLKSLPVHAAYSNHRSMIEKNVHRLDNAIEDAQTAQSQLKNVSLLWPYVNLSLLVVALALRAGKTGAEWANSPATGTESSWFDRVWVKLMTKTTDGKNSR